jgi:LysM repeat protein
MNNPNPFVPQGSLLEQQSKRRSRLKLAVFCVLAVGIAGLSAMLIQGCKREQTGMADNIPPVDTNNLAMDTNTPPPDTNPPVVVPPVPTNPAPVVFVPPVVTAGTEYVVVKGDTLGKIARKNGVKLKALEDANPTVKATKMKVGDKIMIPAGTGTTAPATAGTSTGADMNSGVSGGGETYTVKSGDTLTKIAKANGTTIKLIESENNLTTTKIKVGQKLKIPAKAEAAAPAPTPAPAAPVAPVGSPVTPSTTSTN